MSIRISPEWDLVPAEVVVHHLFSKLDGADLTRCRRVCRAFKEMIDGSDSNWRNCFKYEHAGYLPKTVPTEGWVQFYRQYHAVKKTLASGCLPEGAPYHREVQPVVEPFTIRRNGVVIVVRNGTISASDVDGKKMYELISGSVRPFTQVLATDKHVIGINERASYGFVLPQAEDDNQAFVYELATGKLLHKIALQSTNNPFYNALQAQLCENWLVAMPRDEAATIACWDLDTGAIVRRIRPVNGQIFSFRVAAANRLALSTTRAHNDKHAVAVWDLESETRLSQQLEEGCSNYVLDGIHVRVRDNIMYYQNWAQDKVHFWDVTTARRIGTMPLKLKHFDGARLYTQNKVYDLTQVVPQRPLHVRIFNNFLRIIGIHVGR